jgi:hypothetical protein
MDLAGRRWRSLAERRAWTIQHDKREMSMSEGVTVTVAWVIKPEFADTFVESLRGMFPETRLRKGFRNIRLLKSDVDATSSC